MLHEVYVFLTAMGSGLTAGFLYDLFRLKRKALKTKAVVVSLEDIAFWILTAIIVFVAAFASNHGEIRLYFFLAVIFGVGVYYWLLSRWVIQILTFLVKVLIWPAVFLIKLMRPPAKWLYKQLSKGAARARNQLRQTGIKMNSRMKIMRHIIKKL
ncbi:MAG: spore cortex biosynthesis protein YabQ [Clostridiaceae bacterium]|nr:spore cortex biosynthesis protein YabQ [Clostridiaceae bacterium]